MTGAFPQLTVHHHGSGNFYVAVTLVDSAPVVNQSVAQNHALGQEEGEAGAFVTQHVQTQFLTQLTVVALLCFFQHLQVVIQFYLVGEAGTVNTLQHLAAGVTTPVSAGNVHQLDCVALYASGGVQVRTCTQVNEITLLVEADNCIFRQVVDQFYLVGFVLFFHQLQCFFARQFEAFQLQLFLANLAHFSFQSSQSFGSENGIAVDVVVEAVIDGGTDRQLCFGVQALHSLCQNMAGGMTIHVAVFFVFESEFHVHTSSFFII